MFYLPLSISLFIFLLFHHFISFVFIPSSTILIFSRLLLIHDFPPPQVLLFPLLNLDFPPPPPPHFILYIFLSTNTSTSHRPYIDPIDFFSTLLREQQNNIQPPPHFFFPPPPPLHFYCFPLPFHYSRSSVEKKLSLGQMQGRYEVRVFENGKTYRINEEVEEKENQDCKGKIIKIVEEGNQK